MQLDDKTFKFGAINVALIVRLLEVLNVSQLLLPALVANREINDENASAVIDNYLILSRVQEHVHSCI